MVDPEGDDAQWVMHRNSPKVILRIPVYFTGSGATPDTVGAIERRLESVRITNPNYSIDVVQIAGPGKGINTLDLSPGLNTQLCGDPGECVNERGGNYGHIDSSEATAVDAAAHDIPHFAGIKDRYREGRRDESGRRTSSPRRGYTMDNLMVDRAGTEITGEQFEEAERGKSTTKVCVTETGSHISKCN